MIDLADLAQRAGLDDLRTAAERRAGAALVAHLGDDVAGPRQFAKFAGFGHAVRQRLLAVNVLAGFHERLAQGSMPVVRRGDQDGVEAGCVVEQSTIVFICLGILGRVAAGVQGVGPGLVDHCRIRIAQGHQIRAAGQQALHYAASLPAAADQREVQLAVGGCRFGLGTRQDQRPAEHRRPQSCR